MMEMWDIESTVKEITKDATKQEELMSALIKGHGERDEAQQSSTRE